jgi:hypothetical protein
MRIIHTGKMSCADATSTTAPSGKGWRMLIPTTPPTIPSHTVTEETKEIKIPREVFGVGSIVKVVSVDPADDFTAAEVGMNPRKIGGDDHEDG